MKIAFAYLSSTVWFIALCAAAHYGWGQGVEGVRNLVYLLLSLQMMAVVLYVFFALLCIYADANGKEFERPEPVVQRTTIQWVVWRTLILSCVFAWYGSLLIAITLPLLVAVWHLVRMFFNVAVAKSDE